MRSPTIIQIITNSPLSELETELLLCKVLSKSHSYLYAYSETRIEYEAWQELQKMFTRRTKNEPMAYILKNKEFYGLNFYVNPAVLIPRPETETLVEKVLSTLKEQTSPVVEIGTGSGCIAIAIAKNSTPGPILATDISKTAIKTARYNSIVHAVEEKIDFEHGDLLTPLLPWSKQNSITKPIILVANLPYISPKEHKELAEDIRAYEPRQALVAKQDGLEIYDHLFEQIAVIKDLQPIEKTFIEIAPWQTDATKVLIKKHLGDINIEVYQDLSKKDRIVCF